MGHPVRDCAGPQDGPACRAATTHHGRAVTAYGTNTRRGSPYGDCVGATMNPLTLALTLSLSAPSLPSDSSRAEQQVAARDEWFAEDKLKHMFTSMALVGYGQATARTAGVARGPSVAIGVSLTAVAGFGSEWHDRRQGRPFSPRDLAWVAVGIAASTLLVRNVRE